MHLLPRLVSTLLLSVTALAGCSATVEGDGDVVSSNDALTAAGGRTQLVFLGSSAFLRQCAGQTLGCGAAVSSIPDSTPYFSAPSSWGRSACNQYFTFRANGRCIEARRLEVSDRHNFIEGNPGLFDGLGLAHSDGRACHGSGGASNVQVTPGRHCGDQGAGSTGGEGKSAPPAKTADDGSGTDDGSSTNGKGARSDDGSSTNGKGAPSDDGSSTGGKDDGSSGSSKDDGSSTNGKGDSSNDGSDPGTGKGGK